MVEQKEVSVYLIFKQSIVHFICSSFFPLFLLFYFFAFRFALLHRNDLPQPKCADSRRCYFPGARVAFFYGLGEDCLHFSIHESRKISSIWRSEVDFQTRKLEYQRGTRIKFDHSIFGVFLESKSKCFVRHFPRLCWIYWSFDFSKIPLMGCSHQTDYVFSGKILVEIILHLRKKLNRPRIPSRWSILPYFFVLMGPSFQ